MKSTNKLLSCIASALFSMVIPTMAQNYGKICTLEVQATASKAPNQIVLTWPLRTDIKNYALQRKATGTTQVSVSLPATATGYTDSAAAVGVGYEYKVIGYPAVTGEPTAYGSVLAGIELPLVESRGTVLLVTASNLVAPLSAKIARLVDDLNGEGWVVDQLTVSPTDTVAAVKGQIVSRYNAAAAGSLKSVILLGHVPVPYSGNLNPDSHLEHKGAWPCDGFYGDIDSNLWTDTSVNNATAARVENRNIPGDGKYDQNTFPSAVEMSVGRIDFSNLPAFAPLTEVELTSRYLDKNHAFRAGMTEVARKGLVDDNLSFMREALAASGRRAMVAGMGSANVVEGDFLTHGTASLLGCGIGYGAYNGIDGVGATSAFASGTVNTVFNQHFGSYFGDWDSSDNVLRSVIAANGVSLTSMWSGRPVLNLYGMALGRSVGECVQASMNQSTDAYLQIGYNQKSIHIALMGDPTLRLFTVRPVSNLKAQLSSGSAAVTWDASPEAGVLGYHVYRADTAGAAYVRRNTALVAGLSYNDAGATTNSRYFVRAVKLETSASGTYFNASCGTSVPVTQLGATTDPIYAWKVQNFGVNAGNETLAGDMADYDKDGVCNLLEYAMGTNPANSGSKSGLQNVCVVNQAGARKLCATYVKCNTNTGVRMTIQCSSDLQNWSTAPASTTISEISGYSTLQVSVPAVSERCFLRVLVERI
jgi:hypothetical protein